MNRARRILIAVSGVALAVGSFHAVRWQRQNHPPTGALPPERGATAVASGVALDPVARVANPEAPRSRAEISPVHPDRNLTGIPAGRLRAELLGLSAGARHRALTQLSRQPVPSADYASLHVVADGSLFYACAALPAGTHLAASSAAVPASAPAAVSVPISSPPLRHSRAGATKVLYLDFNGHTITGTVWNTLTGAAASYTAKPYDFDSDASTFSAAEQAVIISVWERVAEDFAPFDVDVTTEEPAEFTSTTGRALITHTVDANGVTMPYETSGGVAFVGVYGESNYATAYSPALVYFNNLATTYPDYIAEAVSHELGHNLGLSHDGQTGVDYYPGHGSGDTSWGPIMGTGYNQNVSQWSKGEYYLANNAQDDLAVMAHLLGYRADDAGNTVATATALPTLTGAISTSGLVGSTADVDVYAVTTDTGTISFSVATYRALLNTHGGNLDVKLELLDAGGAVVATHDPSDSPDAALSYAASAGSYFVRLTPVGIGSPLAAAPTGYTDYGSLGQYTLTGSVLRTAQEITFDALGNLTYGAAPFALTATASSGLDVTCSIVSGPAIVTDGILSLTGVGTVVVRAEQNGNGIYSAADPVQRSFTVAKAPLNAKADNKTKYPGDANPELTITFTGFVYGETKAVLSAQPTIVTSATEGSGEGVYPITLSGGSASNYTLTRTNGVLVVLHVNVAPSVSFVMDQIVAENGSTGAIGFFVEDQETPASSLTVTASSSNPTLVPSSGIALGGSGTNRTIAITPASNQSGTATITISASDGQATGSSSFQISVAPANQPPLIGTVSNQAVNEGSSTGALAFTIGDSETAAASLEVSATSSNLTLVPLASIALGGSGSDRTITITPAAGQDGTATLTLFVSDGVSIASTSFELFVNARPTISGIEDQFLQPGEATEALAFTVSDVESEAAELTVSATSSNLELVPEIGIELDGATGERTITITPADNQNGSALIVLSVDDGAAVTSTSFLVTVNSPPTITSPANQTVAEDTATSAIAFTVGDADTDASDLIVTATSSDLTLLPAGKITIGGSGANRTVKLTPAANLSGNATITLSVSDGVLTADTSFTLTVTAVNDAPTISSIANQTILEDGATGTLTFTVADVETLATALIVTATSSNSILLDAAGIALGGSTGVRSIKLTPKANQSGTSTISVVVSDGVATATKTFALTVTAVNDAPTLSAIAAQTTKEDTATAAIPFTVSDVETAAASLVVTATSSNAALVPNTGIVLGGTTANRTIKLTPLANQSGTSTISVVVSDGVATAKKAFVLTVTAVNDAPAIASISSQTIEEDATLSLAVAVADTDTALASLLIAGSSSNQALVVNSAIVSTDTGELRIVNIKPVANQSGSTTITLTVSDGALSAKRSFNLTVTPVNDKPKVSTIPTQTLALGASPIEPGFTVSDAETAAESIVVTRKSSNTTLLPNAGLLLRGKGAKRTIRITPAAGKTGSAVITLTASDGVDVTTSKFTVKVVASSEAKAVEDRAITLRAQSETISLDRETCSLAITLTPSIEVEELTFALLLPKGWTYLNGAAPGARVFPGPGETDLIEWTWTSPRGASPAVTAILHRPASSAPAQTLDGLVRWKQGARTGEIRLAVDVDEVR